MNYEILSIETARIMADIEKENKELQDRIKKAIDKLYCWGEVLHPVFEREMLDILKGEDNE